MNERGFDDMKDMDLNPWVRLKKLDGDRGSHLHVTERHLEVVGVLPHLYKFEPSTIQDADTLINWLQAWKERNQ